MMEKDYVDFCNLAHHLGSIAETCFKHRGAEDLRQLNGLVQFELQAGAAVPGGEYAFLAGILKAVVDEMDEDERKSQVVELATEQEIAKVIHFKTPIRATNLRTSFIDDPRPQVPLRSKADIEIDAERYRGSQEKVATADVGSLKWRGVAITSRYDKANEYELMLDMVERLSRKEVALVISIRCDSKAGSVFSVELRETGPEDAWTILKTMEVAAVAKQGGHNGFNLRMLRDCKPEWQADLNPYWIQDDAPDGAA